MKRSTAKKVLVMDDDGPTRSFVQSILEAEGHTVMACKNGKEGVAAFKKSVFDLVITDIAMPIIDGIDAIILIRKENGAVPIIAMSGAERGDSLLKFADYFAADATLHKPFEKKALLGMVEKVLKPG
jgi:CheY-like chemotaxis protein